MNASQMTGRIDAMMTVGELSRRTGVPVKKLRQYEGMGLIYSRGRSAAGYRLFDDNALWCVEWISGLRALGLTEAQIRELSTWRAEHPDQPSGPYLAQILHQVRMRIRARIDELEQTRERIDAFEDRHDAMLRGCATTDPWGPDPRNPRKAVPKCA